MKNLKYRCRFCM